MLMAQKIKIKKVARKKSVSKKNSKVKNKTVKKKSKKVVFTLFAAVFILLALLVYLLAYNFGFFEEETGPQFFSVKDECSLMMGNLIHQIRDEGECRNKCVNECDVRDMDFFSFEFEAKNDDCSYCGCYCK